MQANQSLILLFLFHKIILKKMVCLTEHLRRRKTAQRCLVLTVVMSALLNSFSIKNEFYREKKIKRKNFNGIFPNVCKYVWVVLGTYFLMFHFSFAFTSSQRRLRGMKIHFTPATMRENIQLQQQQQKKKIEKRKLYLNVNG